MSLSNCKKCNKEFKKRKPSQKCCSIKCSRELRKAPIATCNNCGKDIKGRNPENKHNFCCRECYDNFRKTNNITGDTKKDTVKCAGCNKDVITTKHKKYCSDKCFRINQRQSVCTICGVNFSRIYDHHNSYHTITVDHKLVFFCCNECKSIYHDAKEIDRRENISKTNTGISHWKKPDINSIKYRMTEYKREKIRLRDSHTCQMCGVGESKASRKLDTHHIIAIKNAKNMKTIHEPWNLISLCQQCHAVAEKWA